MTTHHEAPTSCCTTTVPHSGPVATGRETCTADPVDNSSTIPIDTDTDTAEGRC